MTRRHSRLDRRNRGVVLPVPALIVAVLTLAPALAFGVRAVSATTVPPASRPATVDGPVPANLRPSLSGAARDFPQPYLDGCHTGEDGKMFTGTCLYGNLKSTTTIAIFGDSHALSWFPAVLRVANQHGWRVLSLTMSACSPADIRNWIPAWNRVSTECVAWRRQAISRLVKVRPAIILVSGTRGFRLADASGTVLTGDARTQAWQAGMQRTLARLKPAAGHVIVIADTPLSLVDPPVCLSQHPKSVLACATPVAKSINQVWLDGERRAAAQAGVGFIDPSLWVCPSSPCPVTVGNALIFRNQGHLTATFAATLSSRLGQAILALL